MRYINEMYLYSKNMVIIYDYECQTAIWHLKTVFVY